MTFRPFDRARLGRVIAARCAELGLSKAELARQAELHRNSISNLTTRDVYLSTLVRVAGVLGYSTSELIALAETPADG